MVRAIIARSVRLGANLHEALGHRDQAENLRPLRNDVPTTCPQRLFEFMALKATTHAMPVTRRKQCEGMLARSISCT